LTIRKIFPYDIFTNYIARYRRSSASTRTTAIIKSLRFREQPAPTENRQWANFGKWANRPRRSQRPHRHIPPPLRPCYARPTRSRLSRTRLGLRRPKFSPHPPRRRFHRWSMAWRMICLGTPLPRKRRNALQNVCTNFVPLSFPPPDAPRKQDQTAGRPVCEPPLRPTRPFPKSTATSATTAGVPSEMLTAIPQISRFLHPPLPLLSPPPVPRSGQGPCVAPRGTSKSILAWANAARLGPTPPLPPPLTPPQPPRYQKKPSLSLSTPNTPLY